MKKSIFLLVIIFVGIFFTTITTSCTQQPTTEPNLKLSVKMDTTIMYPVPITKPRYGCNGEKLINDQLLKIDSIPVLVSLDTLISGKGLSIVPVKKSEERFNLDWLWPILEFLLGILLFALALLLLAFILRWLFRQFTQTNNLANLGQQQANLIPEKSEESENFKINKKILGLTKKSLEKRGLHSLKIKNNNGVLDVDVQMKNVNTNSKKK